MHPFPKRSFLRLALTVAPLIVFPHDGASAQDGSMKACGEKWQAAKAANATNGATWPKFLAECRAAMAKGPVDAAPVKAATTTAAMSPVAKSESKSRAEPVFPGAVPAKFAELRPSQARLKTCSEQYQSNKVSNANGGLRWLEKGGGYWSLCNRKLKGA